MPTLWGNNNNDTNEANGEAANMAPRDPEDSRREPTERDRLLPDQQQNRNNHGRSDGYLDPDDPAVSGIIAQARAQSTS